MWAYNYDAFNVNLPSGLIKQAQQTRKGDQWLRIRLGNRNATDRPEADTMPKGGASVRTVRCNLPPLPEVLDVVRKKLRTFGSQSWVGQNPDLAMGSTEIPTGSSNRQKSEFVCVEYTVIEYCPNASMDVSDGVDEGCYIANVIGCSKYELITDAPEYDNDNSGGTGGEGGDSGDMCEPTGGDTGLTGPGSDVPMSCEEEKEPCNTNGEHPALDAQNVQDGMDRLWQKSVESGKEQGAFVYPNDIGGYSFNRLAEPLVIRRTYNSLEIRIPENLPDGTILMHTHPTRETLKKFGITNKYNHHPSDEDYDALENTSIDRGYILDPNKIIEYNSKEIIDEIDRCGY